jgi:hypothetical protein
MDAESSSAFDFDAWARDPKSKRSIPSTGTAVNSGLEAYIQRIKGEGIAAIPTTLDATSKLYRDFVCTIAAVSTKAARRTSGTTKQVLFALLLRCNHFPECIGHPLVVFIDQFLTHCQRTEIISDAQTHARAVFESFIQRCLAELKTNPSAPLPSLEDVVREFGASPATGAGAGSGSGSGSGSSSFGVAHRASPSPGAVPLAVPVAMPAAPMVAALSVPVLSSAVNMLETAAGLERRAFSDVRPKATVAKPAEDDELSTPRMNPTPNAKRIRLDKISVDASSLTFHTSVVEPGAAPK